MNKTLGIVSFLVNLQANGATAMKSHKASCLIREPLSLYVLGLRQVQ